jgi:hypothetical protein
MASTLAKVALLLGAGLGFVGLVLFATAKSKAYSGPENAGQQGSFPTAKGWTNEETVRIKRNEEGFIEEYVIHRVVEET